jgi:hypothetical protein
VQLARLYHEAPDPSTEVSVSVLFDEKISTLRENKSITHGLGFADPEKSSFVVYGYPQEVEPGRLTLIEVHAMISVADGGKAVASVLQAVQLRFSELPDR